VTPYFSEIYQTTNGIKLPNVTDNVCQYQIPDTDKASAFNFVSTAPNLYATAEEVQAALEAMPELE
jgi:hypothetical protein